MVVNSSDPVAWMICLLLWSPLKAQKSKTS
jgi:hypothetical protein